MLSNYKEDMQEELQFRSWVHKEDYHITLSFFRECNGGTIRGNKEWIKKQLQKQKNYRSHYKVFSTFGREDQPRIFFGRR